MVEKGLFESHTRFYRGWGSYALIPFCHEKNFSENTEHKINIWQSRKTRGWETTHFSTLSRELRRSMAEEEQWMDW